MILFKKIAAWMNRFKTPKEFPVKPILKSSASEASIAIGLHDTARAIWKCPHFSDLGCGAHAETEDYKEVLGGL